MIANVIKSLKQIWSWLIKPSDSIKELDRIRQSRLLAILSVILIPTSILSNGLIGILIGLDASVLVDPVFLIAITTSLFLTLTYLINRAGHLKLATYLTLVIITLAVFVASIPTNIPDPIYMLYYLVLPIMLGSILLSVRELIGFLIAIFSGLLIFPLLFPQISYEQIFIDPISFVFIVSIVIISSTYHRNQVEHDRQLMQEEKENIYRILLETTFDGVAIHQKGVLIDTNTGFESMFGYQQAELSGMTLLELVPEQYRDYVRQNIGATPALLYELGGLRKDGTSFPFEAITSHLTYKGSPVTVIAVRDVTERKKAEKQLLDEKERLSVTLQSIGDGVITTDVNGRVILLNRVAENLTGWSQVEATNQPLADVFKITDAKTKEAVLNPVQRVLETGNIIRLSSNTMLIAKNKEQRIISSNAAPIRDSSTGDVIGVVLVFRDITEMSRIEHELQKTQKLESLGIMAGGIAHDFNNLLTAIMGNLSIAQFETQNIPNVSSLLEEAEKASIRARELTQQLLTFSKGGAPIKKTVQLAEIIKESTSFVLRGSSSICEYELPNDLWPVDVDWGQLSQVFQNLVLNAIQAMPSGGKIRLRASNQIVDRTNTVLLTPDRYVQISVEDQGIGIPHEIISKIFDPYFSTKEKGYGLGLAICFSIIQKHGGTITVDTELNKGTTFNIFIPASQFTEQAKEKDKPAVSLVKGPVLVMDDEKLVQKTLRNALERIGYTVTLADDGQEAINLYREALEKENPFTLVIMDLTIPGGMGGKETITILREIDPAVTAIVSSGYSNDLVIANYRDYGFTGMIKKPFTLNELQHVIGDVQKKG